ncbi:MAG TPA: TIGR03557 family F420-dependent LLM class oxidoreductase [Candidatus Limnocylindria bacterium]|nr:TIGR03557 family F420-dependent LLM class oxidoreductase [Candidatus Limnocylindria bacterium]
MGLRFGYALSSEEHRPADLVRNAATAEESGFAFAMISDHYHPWVDAQGHSPFVWTVLGGIARETSRLEVATGVTCPMIRIHPAIIAQAAATTADLFEGRFSLGVGTGENLNEHILGDHWPPYAERREMLIESIDIMRGLWRGKLFSHRGEQYVVENARIYTLPAQPPRIMVAASGPESATAAGEVGDGLVVTAPQKEVIDAFRSAGGADKPIYGQVTGCWAASEDEGARTLHRVWPNAGITGDLSQELPLPMHFEQAASNVTPEMLAEKLPVGPSPDKWIESVRAMVEAGVDHIYFHQVGPDQAGFFDFYRRELEPELSRLGERQPVGAGR